MRFLDIALVLLAASSAWSRGVDSDVRRLAQEGLRLLEDDQADAAAERFAEALELGPSEALEGALAYDHGCALLASGQLLQAREAFVRAAAAGDAELALPLARNRALVAAGMAEELGDGAPEALVGDDRQQLVEHVAEAVRHLRTILDARPDDADARHDMAVLKSWLIALRDAWRLADEARAQEDGEEQPPSSVEILGEMIEAQESLLEALAAKPSIEALPDLGQRQREEVGAKVPELREAFERELAQAESQAGPEGPSEEELAQTRTSLEGATAILEQSSESVAGALEAKVAEAAVPAAESLLDVAEQLWRALAPFPATVRRALEEQTEITERATPQAPEQAQARELTELLLKKAEETAATFADADPASPDPALPDPAADPAEALRRAVEAARELGPQALDHQATALSLFEKSDTDPTQLPAALAEAVEARKLLEEIARNLPQDEKSPNSDQGDSGEQDEEEKSDGEQNPDQEQDKGDEEQEQQDDGEDDQPENQPEDQPAEMTPEQIQALLQQVREREAERREELKRLRMMGRVPVERDW